MSGPPSGEGGLPAGSFESDTRVEVDRDSESIRFGPVGQDSRVGMVFLPGGMVDPRAYGPLLQAHPSGFTPVIMTAFTP